MKITHIEQIPIAMPLAKRYDNHAGRMRMYDIDQHIVVKVHGDNGLIGYGDYEDNPRPVPQAEIDALIGTNPFDYLSQQFPHGLGHGALRPDGQARRRARAQTDGAKSARRRPLRRLDPPLSPQRFRRRDPAALPIRATASSKCTRTTATTSLSRPEPRKR